MISRLPPRIPEPPKSADPSVRAWMGEVTAAMNKMLLGLSQADTIPRVTYASLTATAPVQVRITQGELLYCEDYPGGHPAILLGCSTGWKAFISV